MKIFKFVFALLLLSMLSNTITAQESKLKRCVTVSCCFYHGIGIEIYSTTTCVEITAGKATYNNLKCKMTFSTAQQIPNESIFINEDIVLAGLYDDDKNQLVMQKGNYQIVDNSIEFTPVTLTSIQKSLVPYLCVTVSSQGHFFGHTYSINVRICYPCILLKGSFKTALTITPELSDEIKNLIPTSNHEFFFDEDIHINQDGHEFTIPKGKYIINDDGNIYLQEVNIN